MSKTEVFENNELNEKVYFKKLDNGLEVYILKKEGFKKKIGMFGTKYGSIDNDFIDINTQERVVVPNGVAHFLEHKLFEKEGQNALDMFAKKGVSSNAYTSFDHTVYFFETVKDFEECIRMLINLVKVPYFTKENVEKEQGIIGQEISMYDDDPNFVVYFNALRAMYEYHPIRVDIAGTIDSIATIDKDVLYTCYNTFYSLNNMFYIVIGDVDVENTISLIDDELKKYEIKSEKREIKTFEKEEPEEIYKEQIERNMEVYTPQICVGYKLKPESKEETLKKTIISEIVDEMYFSKLSSFYKEQYELQILQDNMNFIFESGKNFSHILILGYSTNMPKLKDNLFKYIEYIKNIEVNKEMFDILKKKKIGNRFLDTDNISGSYRMIIENILTKNDFYKDIDILESITEKDIKEFLQGLDNKKRVVSIVNSKED